MTGYFSVNVLGHTTSLLKFQTKIVYILLDKSSMKVYSLNIGKLLAKININEHILPIFLITAINILAKTMIYKETKNNHILKTVCPISIKQKLIDELSLAYWVYSNNPKVSFYFPETSFRTSLNSFEVSYCFFHLYGIMLLNDIKILVGFQDILDYNLCDPLGTYVNFLLNVHFCVACFSRKDS